VSETHFARRLREVRERAGLSAYALAQKAGLSRQAVSHLELGEREPGWQTVQLLALALGVDCNEFRDPAIRLPRPAAPRPRGRPRKAPPPGEAAREGSARQGPAEEEKPARTRRRKGG
jgi:transcriptional regulator with XRE-family HTH domain